MVNFVVETLQGTYAWQIEKVKFGWSLLHRSRIRAVETFRNGHASSFCPGAGL
jgi:hypothetical protein